MVVKIPSTYNAMLDQPRLNALYAIVSMHHLLMKFLTVHRVVEICGNQALGRQCYWVSFQVKPSSTFLVKGLDTRDELTKKRGEPMKDLVTTP